MLTPRFSRSIFHDLRNLCSSAGILAACATLTFAPRAHAASNTATLTINVGTKVQTVDSRIFGMNTAVWNTWNTTLGDGQVQGLISAAGTQALRYPGGSTADTFHWQNTTLTNPQPGTTLPDFTNTSSDASFGTTFDDIATYAKITGISPQNSYITLNYGSGTVAEGAAWLKYSNITPNQYGFKYWELGNECYGGWEMDGNANPSNGATHDAVEYADIFAQYWVALKAIDPTIKLGAVVGSTNGLGYSQVENPVIDPVTKVSEDGWDAQMFAEMVKDGVTPDFVIYHRYEQGPGQENDAGLLQAASSPNGDPWIRDATNLRATVNDFFGTTLGNGIELDCTENNSVSTNPGKQSVSLVNGLYMADSVGSILQSEFKSLIWWDTFNGQNTGGFDGTATNPIYGWRTTGGQYYGDYGIMTAGGSPYPTYYVHKLLSHFARGGDTVVQATSAGSENSASQYLVAVYAAKHVDNSLAIMVINKDPTNTWTGAITINGYNPPSTATVYSYGIPQDSAAQTNPGSAAADIQQSTMTGISSSFSATFAPYSVTVLNMVPPLPTITTSPTSQTINKGSTLVLTAVGSNASSYQWSFNGNPVANSGSGVTTDVITGASGPQLVITNPTSASAGSYTVVAVNSTGSSAPSAAATVSVVSSSTPGTVTSISSRAFVGTGNNILIGGFYIVGSTSRTILVQAIGPGIAGPPFNVSGTLSDPTLSIHQYQNSKDVILYTNTGWGSSQILLNVAASVYANPVLQPGSGDSELLITLPPGGYTAEVAGADGTSTGVALCGIYELP